MSGKTLTLAGKVCIVTGATRGIGKGIALQHAQAGATVYITNEITMLIILKPDVTCRPKILNLKFYKF